MQARQPGPHVHGRHGLHHSGIQGQGEHAGGGRVGWGVEGGMAGRVCGLPSWSIGARAVHTRRPGPHFMVDTASTILGSKDRVSMLVGVGWGGGGRRDGR